MRLKTLRLRTPRRSIVLMTIAGASLIVALAGCAGTRPPASVAGGECKIFTPAPFVILGKTQPDQDYIDGEIEAGVGGCGFNRPQARPAEVDAAGPASAHLIVVKAPPVKKKKFFRRAKDRVKAIFRRKPKVRAAPVELPHQITTPDEPPPAPAVANPEPVLAIPAPAPPPPPPAPLSPVERLLRRQ